MPDSVPLPLAPGSGSIGLPGPRGIRRETNGSAIGLAIAIWRSVSTAMPPHSNIPRLPGNTSVPCSDGGVKVPS